MAELSVPEGFQPYSGHCPFVLNVADFYTGCGDSGRSLIGCRIGRDQANTEGFAHGGFMAAFADFALSYATSGITLTLSLDYIRPGRMGAWICAEVTERKRSDKLIFADAMIRSGDRDLVRISGTFRPFRKLK